MTAQPKPVVMPRKPLSRQAIRSRLEEAREDLAMILAGTLTTQAQIHRAIGITDELWSATQPDEAPAFEPSIRMVRAS